ncbi:hypothetical protein ncot_06170 [Nocardioides sp. JQ2195]|uniref:hypothetical protein n=1 Tax=Nocardioides sp. JQ2195 TaxID=2592334 RepID=UPI00143EEC4F|nr:hypothetical protein [Nocardioides sp. JQ2195]QIX26235.1 hypothetical protein ncot_06170 [Nocardioides sp. JQ2195]
MSAITLRRLLAAVGLLIGLLALTACGEDESGDSKSSKDPATPASQAPGTDSTDGPAGAPSTDTVDSSLPLNENAPAAMAPPLWAFPIALDGWEWSTRDQNGLNQLERSGGEVLFTSYQLTERDTDGHADASDSKAWLEKYVNEMRDNPRVVDVGVPAYSTAEVDSDRGTVEFVRQDVTYETSEGTTYKSRFLARSLGPNLLAVQYAAPVAEWSEEEWEELTGTGLMVTLGA